MTRRATAATGSQSSRPSRSPRRRSRRRSQSSRLSRSPRRRSRRRRRSRGAPSAKSTPSCAMIPRPSTSKTTTGSAGRRTSRARATGSASATRARIRPVGRTSRPTSALIMLRTTGVRTVRVLHFCSLSLSETLSLSLSLSLSLLCCLGPEPSVDPPRLFPYSPTSYAEFSLSLSLFHPLLVAIPHLSFASPFQARWWTRDTPATARRRTVACAGRTRALLLHRSLAPRCRT
jgi:hypothetical protein